MRVTNASSHWQLDTALLRKAATNVTLTVNGYTVQTSFLIISGRCDKALKLKLNLYIYIYMYVYILCN